MTPIVIKVYNGQTLQDISKIYNVPETLIKQYNNLECEISEGDRLLIPFEVKALHIVKPLETLNKIAKQYNTTIEKIKIDNNLVDAPLFIGQQLMIL